MSDSQSGGATVAERYCAWISRHGTAVIVLSALTLAISALLIWFRLPLYADFSYLLPQDAPSVRDLRRLETRLDAQDTVLLVARAGNPSVRADVAAELAAAVRRLPPTMVSRVEDDDAALRQLISKNRFLFVPLKDLEATRDALRDRVRSAKLAANPLYVDLDDAAERDAKKQATDAAADRLTEFRHRWHEAEARLARSGLISADQLAQLIVVRTAFPKTDAHRAGQLLDALGAARAQILAAPGRAGAEIGFTGGVVAAHAEHTALVRGMLLSSLVTGALVAITLALYFRSLSLFLLLTLSLLVGVGASFGAAALTVGHLNAATAFLGAIIAGNGVNYGILLIARYLEERSRQLAVPAMARAVRGTLRPTLVASLGAAIAYGSLAATRFRGFADFAIIGAIGMVLCWLAAYVLLPVLMLRFAPNPRAPSTERALGRALAALFAFRRPAVVAGVAALICIASGWVAYRYVAGDPFEYDMKKLRSEGRDASEARRWLELSDRLFGRGISGATYIAADRADQVPLIVDALRAAEAANAREGRSTIGAIQWIGDLVPPHQDEKRAVLADIRRLLSGPVLETLDAREKAEIEVLMPPADPGKVTLSDVPRALVDRMRERDGRVGLFVAVRPALQLDEWNGRDLIRFASAVRQVRLANGETLTTSGPSVIFADIVATIAADGPRVTGLAAAGIVAMVLFVIGWNVRSAAVLIATGLGSLVLVAACAALGVRVNFLDFVALPITIGLGVDYAVNIAHRHGRRGHTDAATTLRTSGSAVFICSLTTIIGYGSLIVSENLAIRSFGVASLIGEVACLLTALILVPAIVSMRNGRRGTDGGLVS